MIRIILVRHGETKWNKEGRFQGQKDIPLSACGMKQACCLADALRPVPIDICLSSPLSRAFTTCRLCAEPHSSPSHQMPVSQKSTMVPGKACLLMRFLLLTEKDSASGTAILTR